MIPSCLFDGLSSPIGPLAFARAPLSPLQITRLDLARRPAMPPEAVHRRSTYRT
jgi:hypothetical protein